MSEEVEVVKYPVISKSGKRYKVKVKENDVWIYITAYLENDDGTFSGKGFNGQSSKRHYKNCIDAVKHKIESYEETEEELRKWNQRFKQNTNETLSDFEKWNGKC